MGSGLVYNWALAAAAVVVLLTAFGAVQHANCEGCDGSLGARHGGSLNASSFTSSSDFSTYTAPRGRLNSSAGWIPMAWSGISASNPEYLQIDFLTKHRFTAVATKGLKLMIGFFVSSFKLSASLDGVTFTPYSEMGEVKTFTGNVDRLSLKRNEIPCSLHGRYLRFIPMGFGTGIGLQVDVYGCRHMDDSTLMQPVKELGVLSINANRVLIQWDASKDDYKYYTVTVETVDPVEGVASVPARTMTAMKSTKSLWHVQEVDALSACTLYRITIKPFGVCGEGQLSHISVATNPVVPPEPTILSVVSLEALKILILWEDGLQDSRCISNISGYIVQYRPVMSSDPFINRTVLNPSATTPRKTIELSDLIGWTKYELQLIAFGPYGQSGAAASQVDVDGIAPTEGPTITQLRCLKPNSLTVSWRNPPADKAHGSIKGFSIHYKPRNSTAWLSVVPQSLQTTATLDDLLSWQEYDVNVMLHINKYNSSSEISTVMVMGKAPYKGPHSLRVDAVTSTSVSLLWEALPTSYFFGTLDGYVVHYGEQGSQVFSSMMTTVSRVVLSKLQPSTSYSVVIVAVANGMDSPKDASIIVTTASKQRALQAPQVTALASASPKTIFVTWTLPSDNEGLLRFTLMWRESGIAAPWSTRRLPTTLTGFTIVSLKAWEEYDVLLQLTRDTETVNSTGMSTIVTGEVPGLSPGNVKATSPSPGTVDVTWEPINPAYKTATFTGYAVFYHVVGPLKVVQNATTPADSESITITNLVGGATYSFSVAGLSAAGRGPLSAAITSNIKKQVTPPRIPVITRLVAASSTSVKVTWDQPDSDVTPVNKFLITAIDPSRRRHILWHAVGAAAVGMTLATAIVGLQPYTSYAVTVQATTVYGGMELNSKPSVVKSVMTLSGAPSAPRNITMALSGSAVTIKWSPPAQKNGILNDYKVVVLETTQGTTVFSKSPSARQVVVLQLKPFTNYTVKVNAATIMDGPSAVKYFLTDGVPSPPRNVSAKANSTHIFVHWMVPLQPKGKVQGYQVNYIYSRRTGVTDNNYFIEGDTNVHVLSNVIPGANYEIKVAAKTSLGFGRVSTPVVVATPMMIPGAPPVPAVYLVTVTSSSVTIELKAEPNAMSGVKSYQVIVENLDGKLRRRRSSSLPTGSLLSYVEAKALKLRFYIAAQVDASTLPLRFAIGDGNNYNGYFNAPLHPESRYRTHVRAITEDANGDSFAGPSSSVDLPITAPRVDPEPASEDFKIPLPIIAGAAGGLLLLIVIIIIIIIYLRSSNASRKRAKQGVDPYDLELSKMRLHSETDGQHHPTSLTGDIPLHPDHPPVIVPSFQKHVNKLHKSDNAGFKTEYNQLEIGKEFSWDVAHLPCNKTKNRYANIVAYDHSRVLLEDVDDEAGSNYVNASYIDGYMRPNAYVATQGPLPSTFDDFWRMMWELRSTSIVMLTNLQEKNKLKCHKYWPDDETQYGKMKVTQTRKELYADYAIRTFKLERRGTSESREVRQFHFTVWPDHGVPQYATAILAFRRRARVFMQVDDTGPTVVHCSAGVGRTGTYIAIDATLDRMTKQGDIDIFNFIAAMRTRRIAMVQTEEQYVFVHDAVLEAIICGNTQIPVQDLRAALLRLDRTESDSKMCGYEKEWKTLNNVSPILPKTAFTVALLTDNVNKNRYSCVVPADLGRVELQPIDDEVATTYINAVYVDGYKQRNAFILTQSPLPNTTADFWRMLCEHRSGSVVMLNNLEEGDDYTKFWPERQGIDYEMISVESLSETLTTSVAGKVSLKASNRHSENEIIIRKFKVTDSRNPDSHFFVKIFQYLGWTETKAPPSCKAVISLAGLIEKWQQRSGNGPITIMCSDGLGRSGTFAALVAVLERLKVEQVIDVFQTVKAMRIQRPHQVKYLDQYKFIHLAVQEYLSAFDDYANFK